MAKGPRYRVQYRRRRKQKTDYKARRIMAVSETPRFVVRFSGGNILIQITKSEMEGDHTITQANSYELVKKFGWLGGRKNTPAAYLLGLIVGYKSLNHAIKDAILDAGLMRPKRGSRLFAALKGALDAGLKVPCDDEVIPDADRIEGAIIAEYAGGFDDPLEYERMFSGYLRRGLKPELLMEHFREVKAKIEEEIGV